MEARFDPNCGACQVQLGLQSLTNAPRILEAEHWLIEHVHPTSVLGWLVIVLRRHCKALHDLTEPETAELGWLMPATCRALHHSLGTEKEYVMQFAESDGFHHVHFHLVARLPEWPDALKGPRVAAGLGDYETALSSELTTALALEVREYLLREQARLSK